MQGLLLCLQRPNVLQGMRPPRLQVQQQRPGNVPLVICLIEEDILPVASL